MEVSDPKLVNPVLNNIAVNPLRLGGLQISLSTLDKFFIFYFVLVTDVNIS